MSTLASLLAIVSATPSAKLRAEASPGAVSNGVTATPSPAWGQPGVPRASQVPPASANTAASAANATVRRPSRGRQRRLTAVSVGGSDASSSERPTISLAQAALDVSPRQAAKSAH